MKAVILSAGLGNRLRPWTDDVPKSLLALDPGGATALDLLLDQCAAAGADEALVVVGHGRKAVEDALERRAGASTLRVRTVLNPDYATMGNGRSLLAVRPHVEGATLVKFDGDLVLHAGILPRLLASPWRTALVLDDVRRPVAEDMKAALDEPSGRVVALGKGLTRAVGGVSIGVERIDARDVDVVFDALDRLVHAEGRADGYYEDAYDIAIREGLEMGTVPTGGLPWVEFDTPEDLERARRLVRGVAHAVPGPEKR